MSRESTPTNISFLRGCAYVLRVQIARRMVSAGCNLSPSDILITSGGRKPSISACTRSAVRGISWQSKSPSYFGTLQMLEVHGLRALETPTHPRDGISLEALEFAIEHNPIRAVFVISNFNNPLGSQIPDERKKALVDFWHNTIPLIENNVCGELYFGEKRPLVCKAFDTKGLVILLFLLFQGYQPGTAPRMGGSRTLQYGGGVAQVHLSASSADPASNGGCRVSGSRWL